MAITQGTQREAVERAVLDITGQLLAEVRASARPGQVRPDDSLERDLALGSLERVELLLRLEQAFKVKLPDTVLASAQMPRDLVDAVLAGGPAEATVLERLPALPTGTPAPDSARTLIHVLGWHAETHASRPHIFLREEDGQERAISYGELLNGATAMAAGLRRQGLGQGETVALMLRTEEAFFRSFFGVLLAGGVPVPLYPPFRPDRLEEYAHRQAAILRNADARVMITFGEVERLGQLMTAYAPALRIVTLPDRLAAGGGDPPDLAHASDDAALIQYTSGSTGEPKGVLLSHANLLANIRAIGGGIQVRGDEVCVSWLPLYHDMGLIGSWLSSLYHGVPVVLMSPLAFLSRPSRWLRAIHARRGTVSPAPNFAYDLCARKIPDEELEGLDLSSWRLALNGSEPVSQETIERFTRRFEPYGFRPEAMAPVYGLAECAVGLAMPPIGRGPRVDVIARTAFLADGRATPAPPGDKAPLRFVSCGRPLPDHEILVVDDSGRPAGERRQGRVQFRGPSVTAGYFRNPEATRAVQHDGWMDSGDLGYVADDELFITSRKKDLVILGGRNVYPQEVEELASDVAGVRKGCVAAFGVHDPNLGTERLVVVAESRETDPTRHDSLRAAIVDRVAAALGMPPDTVVIARPGAVLKTSSGKIRRGATRDAYLQGTLGRRQRSAPLQMARLGLGYAGRRLGRMAGAAGRGIYTGYVLTLVALSAPWLWVLLVLSPTAGTGRFVLRAWSRALLALGGVRLRVTGLEHLRAAGPAVMVCNHASYIDVVTLMAALPGPYSFLAKRALTGYPLIGTGIRRAGHLTLERGELTGRLAGYDDILAHLRAGRSLLIFPEGTFREPPGLLPFKLGAFRAAAESGRPVVPLSLRGTRHILPDNTILLHPGRVELIVDAPVMPAGESWRDLVELRDRIRSRIAERVGEPLAG